MNVGLFLLFRLLEVVILTTRYCTPTQCFYWYEYKYKLNMYEYPVA